MNPKRFIAEQDYEIMKNVEKLRMPMSTIWQILVKAKLLNAIEKVEENIDNFCDFYTIYSHIL